MAYVYTHTRLDTGEVFYVGIGNKPNHFRAHERDKRNKHWIAIVTKTLFRVDIIYDNLSWIEACEKETGLILFYGRKDLKTGTLCNWTNGGEGAKGAIVTSETKAKISLGKTGVKKPPVTDIARLNLSLAMKGKMPKNFEYLHSPAIVAKRIKALKGSQKPATIKRRIDNWTGTANPRAVKIIQTDTGNIYDTLNAAWKASELKISRSFFSMMMIGSRDNKTKFKYA